MGTETPGNDLNHMSEDLERRSPPERITLAHLVSERDPSRRFRLIARYLVHNAPPADGADLRLAEDLGLSSLDIVELLALVEAANWRPASTPFVGPNATVGDLRAQVGPRREAPADGVRRNVPARDDATTSGANVPSGPAAWTVPLQFLQPVTRTLAIAVWTHFMAVIEPHWAIDTRRLDCPFFLAAAPHRHWLDAFVIDRALPFRLGRRLHLLVEHDFSEHFRPDPDTPLRSRLSDHLCLLRRVAGALSLHRAEAAQQRREG